jgi:hypothetical protein
MIDRIQAGRVNANTLTAETIMDLQQVVTIIEISNCVDYWFDARKGEDRNYGLEDLPNMRLPFPVAWFEGHGNQQMYTLWNESGRKTWLPKRWGILACELDPAKMTLEGARSQAASEKWAGAAVVNKYTLFEPDGRGACGVSSMYFALSEDGRPMPEQWTHPEGPDGGDALMCAMATEIVAFATSLCHCRNVSLVSHQQQYPQKQRRAFERDLGHPLVEYRVIRIDPLAQGKDDREGLSFPHRFHICRGHFRTYLPRAPLFGRLTGTFWVPAHARGNADLGMIVKDYAFKKRKKGAA